MSEFVSGLEKVGTALAAVAIVLGILLIVFFLALAQAAMARIRIEQMVRWCLTYLGIPALINIGVIAVVIRQLGA